MIKMECQRCKTSLKEEEAYDYHGKTLCEDCYIYVTNPPRGCDPLAVASALSVRKQLGQTGSSGLTEVQQKIYSTIEKQGKITKEELLKTLNINPEQLEQNCVL